MPRRIAKHAPLNPGKKKRSVLAYDAEEQMRLIVESARDFGIFTTDTNGMITTWNVGAERLFGYSEKEIVGCDGLLLFTQEDRANGAAVRELKTALKTGRAADDRWHLRRDGTKFWGSGLAMGLRDPKGEICGILKMLRDLTEKKRAEEMLQRTAKRLRAARDSLEKRVTERTNKFREANRKLRVEMAQRRELERVALEASEHEQRRIGQDLHDTVCQHVAGLALLAKTVARKLQAAEAQGAAEVDEIGDSLRKVVGDLRVVARGLYPVELERNGLMGALQELCRTIRAQKGVRCRLVCPEPVIIKEPSTALHLFRIAQESVTNVLKHAGATHVTISLLRNGVVVLQVSDNGVGFDPLKIPEGSMGLEMMRYRANVIGASLTLGGETGGGTTVACELPLPA